MNDETRAAMIREVPCKQCHARAGTRCKTPSYHVYPGVHVERVTAYKQQQTRKEQDGARNKTLHNTETP